MAMANGTTGHFSSVAVKALILKHRNCFTVCDRNIQFLSVYSGISSE